ncbi:CLUMA_CG009771, isoform A [Gryllus bimaculatus]|nr:CLUMA_CG009771, isoform A [Gryllus bimaculatus]
MALLNRFFPNKKKSHKQGYVPFGKSDHSGWKPFNFSREQVRLLLFRECDARGRKLLFDSSAVLKTVIENTQCSKSRLGSKPKCDNPKRTEAYVEVTNGVGYQYTRPSSDVNLMGEMIFGSVAMTFKGMVCKVHCMKSPDRLMCSRVFHAPSVSFSSKRASDQSIDSSGSSISSINDSLFSLSGNHEAKLTPSNSSGPLDVPRSDSKGKAPMSSLEGDSGFCGDASLCSISSVGSGLWGPYPNVCDSRSASQSTLGNSSTSGGSLASLQRRWMKNVSTTLEHGIACSPWHFIRRKNSSGVNDEVASRMHRKTQLGFTVVMNVSLEQEKDMEIFFFEHMAVIEGMLERLQSSVEKAYVKKDVFVHLMMEAFHNIQQWLCDLFTAPRLLHPVWIGLVSPESHCNGSRFRCNIMTVFLRDLCQLIAAIDTKSTNFFISTLVTAVLTHHLGWVATIMPAKAPPSSVTKPPCAIHDLAKSHPYNALWAQLGDLHGALGNPVKIARTIVTANGKKSDLLNKLLISLSYFIRSGNIEKRIDSEIGVDNESNILDSVLENVSSVNLNSSTGSTSTIVPDDSANFGRQDSNIINDSKRNINSEGRERSDFLMEQLVELELSSKIQSSKSHCDTNFKKTNSYLNSINTSTEVGFSLSQNSSKLYPDLLNVDREYLNPDVISEKVSRLCRVPTNALLYHLMNEEPKVEPLEHFPPRKVDCERQFSSLQTKNREKFDMSIEHNMAQKYQTKMDDNSNSHSAAGGVIFVLGDNEELVDLKSQDGISLPKSMSDNVLFSETINVKQSAMKKSSCYPSLEGLSECQNNSKFLGVQASSFQTNITNFNQCAEASENLEVNTRRPTNNDSSVKCFSGCEETGVDSGVGLEVAIARKIVNEEQEFVCDRTSVWKNERTNKSDGENSSTLMPVSFVEDINGNPKSDDKVNSGNSSGKVVTSHSFIIELEDVHVNSDTKIPVVGKKVSKHIARSQSLSFPDRKSLSCKKSVGICRRHSVNTHVNDRYLKDYHSVRFNFERCDGILSDYVDGIGVDKSSLPEKKSIKISEARGNFEFQDKICEKCGHRKDRILKTTVLHSSDMYDCVCNSDITNKHGCKEKSLTIETKAREGNALFDEYGTLSDDELLSSTEISQGKESEVVSQKTESHPMLIELPLPWCNSSQREQGSGLAASLLGGVTDHYMPDMVLHGCTQALPLWEATLKHDLAVSAHRPMLDQEISEAVCIVGNAELWEVQLVSSHVSIVDKPGGFGIRVGMSQLVANMLESLLHLWKLRTPPEQCLQHLESKLRELCLRSQALAELLLTTDLCDLGTLTSSLGLEANDVPLLLAIASTHSPQVTNLYGLTFR